MKFSLALFAITALLTACQGGSSSSPATADGLATQDTLPDHGSQAMHLSDIVTGGSGTYHLVQVQFYMKGNFESSKQGAMQFTVKLSPQDDISTSFDSIDVSQLNDLNASAQIPLTISQNDGQITNDIAVSAHVFSSTDLGQNQIQTQLTSPRNAVMLPTQADGGQMPVYRISDTSFETRISGTITADDGSGTFTMDIRNTYQLVP